MTTITFTRKDRWFNWAKDYKIIVDEKNSFQLLNGEAKTVAIDTPTKVRAKLVWWMGSDHIELNAAEQIQVGPTALLLFAAKLIPLTQILLLVFRDSIAREIRISIASTLLFFIFLCFSVWRNKWLKLAVVKQSQN